MHRRHNTSTVRHHHINNDIIDRPLAGQGTLGPTQSRIVKVSVSVTDNFYCSRSLTGPRYFICWGRGRLAKGVGEPPTMNAVSPEGKHAAKRKQ